MVLTVPLYGDDNDNDADDNYDNNDDDDDDDNYGGDDVCEWVVLTVPLSRQLQFLMQARRCQVLMLLGR